MVTILLCRASFSYWSCFISSWEEILHEKAQKYCHVQSCMRKKETVNTTHTQKSHNKKKFESEYFLLNRESSSCLISPFRSFCIFSTIGSCWALLSSGTASYYLAVQGESNCDNSNESYWAILSSRAVWTFVVLQKYSVLLINFRKKIVLIVD